MSRLRVVDCGLAAIVLATACASAPSAPARPPAQRLELRDDTLAVAIDVTRGGAITSLVALEAGETSPELVDNGDLTGRSIQASLYDGHWGPDCWPCNGTCAWGNNPVQEGDACQRLSGGALVTQTPTSLVTTTTPRQWNSALGVSRLALQQTLTLVAPGVLRIDYRVTNHDLAPIGADNWHELPVAYLSPSLTRGTTSAGQQTQTPMTGFRDGSDWVALSAPAGWTVALVAPGDHLWSIGFGGDTKPTSWLQAWQWLELQPEQTGTATAWLVVGRTLDQVRARIAGIR